MANRKRNLKATIKDDGYEYKDEVLIRRIETTAGIRFQVDLGRIDGKYSRRSFKTLKEARKRASARRIELDGQKLGVVVLDPKQQRDAADAIKALKSYGIDLKAAAHFYIKHNQPVDENNGVEQLIEKYLAWKKSQVDEGLRLSTYKDTVRRLYPLKTACGHQVIDVVTADDIQKVLNAYKPLNRLNYKRYFGGFFRWAVRKGYTTNNPISQLDEIKIKNDTPEIYLPEEARLIINACRDQRPEMVAYYALALFGGVRPDEITKLSWRDIDTEDGTIHIRASVAKTGHARHIEMPGNLKEWLLTCQKRTGKVFPHPESARRRWRKEVHEKSGVDLIPDGARHSMATYYLALHGAKDAVDTLGHSEETLNKHYKGLVKGKKTKAKNYFDITPPKEAKIIQLQRAG